MKIKTRTMRALDQFLENIGLMRTASHEEFKDKCEEFAKDYMEGSSGITVGGVPGYFKGGTWSETAVVCGSNVRIIGARLERGMVVAPWVRNFYADHVMPIAAPLKNSRALVRCSLRTDGKFHLPNVNFRPDEPSHDNQ